MTFCGKETTCVCVNQYPNNAVLIHHAILYSMQYYTGNCIHYYSPLSQLNVHYSPADAHSMYIKTVHVITEFICVHVQLNISHTKPLHFIQ